MWLARKYFNIEKMYPIVKVMLSITCEEAKKEMCTMDQTPFGSWSCAVTCADGVWMTHGFHSKNATFSIRNYLIMHYYITSIFVNVVETVLGGTLSGYFRGC